MRREGEPGLSRVEKKIDYQWGDGQDVANGIITRRMSARWTTTFTPKKSGEVCFELRAADAAELYIDGVKHPAIDGPYDSARGVFVDDKGVHVVGQHIDMSVPYGLPAYWLNGAMTALQADIPAGRLGNAYGVATGNGHVYVAGNVPNPSSNFFDARLWVDGVPTALEGVDGSMTTVAMGAYLHGSDVYAYGGDYNPQTSERHCIIWKNGARLASTSFLVGNYITDFAIVRDGTMYALCSGFSDEGCGLFKVNPNTGSFEVVRIGSGRAALTSLYVDGNDVYVAGYDFDSNPNPFWVLWKNSQAQRLTTPDDWNVGIWGPLAVSVLNGTVYVTGWVPVRLSGSPPNYESRICLWRNGKIETMYAENTGDRGVVGNNIRIFVR
jgi:hypothetical protein